MRVQRSLTQLGTTKASGLKSSLSVEKEPDLNRVRKAVRKLLRRFPARG